jgi:hypothetical protein
MHKGSKYAIETNIQIYGIGPIPMAIKNIASTTGGTVYPPGSFNDRLYLPRIFNELGYYLDLIQAEWRNKYQLCYTPANNRHDGTLRKIKIKLETPPKLPKLTIRARKERYAQKN